VLLTELRAALAEFGVRCVLVRRHRLVLRYGEKAPLEPSGPTDPMLHVFAPDDARVVTVRSTGWTVARSFRPATRLPQPR
jgi:hypothetical protein